MLNSRSLDDIDDKERLQDRLEWEGYSETRVKSDGNCQFRALSDQIYQTSDFHKRVRQEIINQLKSRPKLYKGLVGKIDFSEYIKNMSNDSVWGDDITLKAAADVSIVVLPKSQKESGKVIHLSYLAGIHFNSIHLKEDNALMKKSDKEENKKPKEEIKNKKAKKNHKVNKKNQREST